jgi:hypothetical protein
MPAAVWSCGVSLRETPGNTAVSRFGFTGKMKSADALKKHEEKLKF